MKKIKLLYENVTILKKNCLNWKEVSVGSLININSLLKSSLCLSHFNSKDVSHSCAVRRLWRLDRRAHWEMRAGWASVSRSASYSYLCYWYAGIFKVARMESTFPSTINPETKRWNRVFTTQKWACLADGIQHQFSGVCWHWHAQTQIFK